MHRLAGIGFALALAPMSFCQTTNGVQAGTPFTIAIDQPAYTNEPVWVHAVNGPAQEIRYPIYPAVGYYGCLRLEVRHNGVVLPPRTIPVSTVSITGMRDPCYGVGPDGSPEGRFPLHIFYPFTQPGTYSVRWTFQNIWQSRWLTFTVSAATPEEHEDWIRKLLANPPEDPGHLAGDFLPSLVAAVPDPRALKAFVGYLYSNNQVVAQYASSALDLFPQSEVMPAVMEALEERGPSNQLASATGRSGWTLEDEEKVVRAAAPYLNFPNTRAVPAVPQPYVLSTTGAAIKLIRFILYTPNHAWPADSNLNAWADAQVLRAAPNIIANADVYTVQELAEYLGLMQPSAESHQLLRQMAERSDNVAEQARICLTWHPQPEDLPYLAASLIAPGDADPNGLPSILVQAYGDNAFPYLEGAVANSPYTWVRVESAQQLALHNWLIGFQFFLDQIVQNPWPANLAYKPELMRWIRENFHTELPRDASEDQVMSFLRNRVAELSQQK